MEGHSYMSERALSLKSSMTLAITARAKALKKEGRDICSLSAGEPDFNTPDFIVNAACSALREGITRYGPAAGDPELREAIANKMRTSNNIETKSSEVLITNGGKQAIFNLFQVIINPGDEVLIPAPYWLSYPEMVKLAGGIPIAIESSAEDNFDINIDLLESKINDKTKLIIINSPGNPTGRIIDQKTLESIAVILRNNPHILLMSDEIYEYLLAPKQVHISPGAIAPDLKERIFIVNGFAKAWAMTGWRVGYLIGNQQVINSASALQSQSTSNVCSFAQKGALAALNEHSHCVEDMVKQYDLRRKVLVEELRKIQGIDLIEPQGAFYAFPKLPQGSTDSITFCKRALEETGLAVIPGKPFGSDQHIRVSCAASTKTIKEGISRLRHFIYSSQKEYLF